MIGARVPGLVALLFSMSGHADPAPPAGRDRQLEAALDELVAP